MFTDGLWKRRMAGAYKVEKCGPRLIMLRGRKTPQWGMMILIYSMCAADWSNTSLFLAMGLSYFMNTMKLLGKKKRNLNIVQANYHTIFPHPPISNIRLLHMLRKVLLKGPTSHSFSVPHMLSSMSHQCHKHLQELWNTGISGLDIWCLEYILKIPCNAESLEID